MAELELIELCLQDLRSGARILRQAPALSAAVVLLIALVIGGNATVYSMVNSILVSPAPGVNGDGLVVIRHAAPDISLSDPYISFPNFEDYARQLTAVTGLAAWNGQRLTLGTPSGNFALFGGMVTANYFDTFGVKLAKGRGFVPLDDDATNGLAVVISQRVWAERFNQSAEVVGKSITINRLPATIVGVTATGFSGVTLTPGEDLWLPIRGYSRVAGGANDLANRAQPLVLVGGRLAKSALLDAARSETRIVSAQLYRSFPDAFTTYSPQGVVPIRNPRAVVSRYSATALLPIADLAPRFLAMFSVVTLLTLIVVCANVANLLLGRAVERQRDAAVRRSLGASGASMLRMLLAEGATLACVAWVVSTLAAWWASRALLRVVEPQPGQLVEARPDWTLIAYSLVLAVLATVAFSVAPAQRSWRMPVLQLLKAGEHSIARRRSRFATSLLVVQLAFSVVLVTSASLAYRSMTTLSTASLGFKPDNLLLMTVRLNSDTSPGSGAPDGEAANRVVALERIRERLATAEGVEAVSYVRRAPGATLLTTTRIRRDQERAAAGFVRHVGPGYLRVMGMPLIAGRDLAATDRPGTPRVGLVNQRLAMELFGNEPPTGHELFIGDRNEGVEIIGVVTDALIDGPTRDPHPRYLLVAEQQAPTGALIDPSFIIRHRTNIAAVAPAVGRALGEVDDSVPIVSMSTMNARLATVTELETLIVRLVACFAALSLVIATLGNYAVASFAIRSRTREFGVRMALGASSRRIVSMVLREALLLTVPGLAIGLALSLAVALSFSGLLFGVTPADPVTYLGVVVLFCLLTLVASYQAAQRASRVNVIDALRQE